MKLTRRGFLGSLGAVIVGTLGGFLGLASAGPKPKPCGGTLADARREMHKLKESRAKALARSARRTQEQIAANTFNNGFAKTLRPSLEKALEEHERRRSKLPEFTNLFE